VSDIERIKLFKVLEDANGRNVGSNLLGLTPDGSKLVRFDEYSQNPDCELLTTLTISDDLLNRINVIHHMTIDKFSSINTSLTFHPFKPILVITLTSNQFYLLICKKKKLTDWSQQYSEMLPRDFLNLKDKIMGCSFNPLSDSMIL
ncbi:11305_t:CDS:2, partial [Funneliformis caledonium]